MTVKYRTIGFSTAENAEIKRVLADTRGWAGLGHDFKRVYRGEDVVMSLVPDNDLRILFRDKPHLHGLSVTVRPGAGTVGKTEVYINKDNWSRVPANFHGTRAVYRAYVLQHEMGHVLGHRHEEATVDGPCPVMYQQTKGTVSCLANPWGVPPQ